MNSMNPSQSQPVKHERPLSGLRVIDMSRLAPGPYCTMLLADLGAEVICVGGGRAGNPLSTFARGKQFMKLDLKAPEGRQALQALAQSADVFVESFRPGVSERLGAGYEALAKLNPGLIYCSVTGYGQDGPMAQDAGHDISYLALTGVLGALGPTDGPPTVPLNLIADFAGGSCMAAFSIMSALFERSKTGQGKYIDVAMIDGAMSLMAMHYPVWGTPILPTRGEGLLNGGNPYYCCYACKDGKYISVGALETQFFHNLWQRLVGTVVPDHMNVVNWPIIRATFQEKFMERSRDEWSTFFQGTEACVVPVLAPDEIWSHPHIRHRHPNAHAQQVPVLPRFDQQSYSAPETDIEDRTDVILGELGLSREQIDKACPLAERNRIPSRSWPPAIIDTPA